MADQTGSLHLHPDQERVTIAVRAYRNYFQSIARAVALGPQLVARPAEEGDISATQRALEGLLVHEAEHQDLVRPGVLHDGRYQALHFLEINLHFHPRASLRGETKSPLKL
jgi:hypothetical protein